MKGYKRCSALRERLQCTASEMGKTDTEIISPILDKRIARKGSPQGLMVVPMEYLIIRYKNTNETNK